MCHSWLRSVLGIIGWGRSSNRNRMKISKLKWILLVIVAVPLVVLLYPRKVVLIPEMKIRVSYEGGDFLSNGEVSQNWNHYLGDGWTARIAKTDMEGNVSFPEVSRRVPRLVSTFWSEASFLLHYYPGLAGSIKARDANNHFIWQRVDFNDRNCCPKDIAVFLHDEKGEAEDQYFTFGRVISEP